MFKTNFEWKDEPAIISNFKWRNTQGGEIKDHL